MAQDKASLEEFHSFSKAAVAAVGGDAGGGRCGEENDIRATDEDWGWRLRDGAVRPAPAFPPPDPRCARRVQLAADQSIEEMTLRISRACRKMSIYGVWDDACATASLSSMDRVEMDVAVHSAGADAATFRRVVLVELRRRGGDVVAFHGYRRRLLDAAEGKFDQASCNRTDGLNEPGAGSQCGQHGASLARPSLLKPSGNLRPCIARPSPSGETPRPTSIARPSPLGKMTRQPRRGMERPSSIARTSSIARPSPLGEATRSPSVARPRLGPPSGPTLNEHKIVHIDIAEKALKALGTAASLTKKDRVDAQRIGLESLELLTDPLRAGEETARIAGRMVLLGSTRESHDDDALFNESAGLGIRETVLETIAHGAACQRTSELDALCGDGRNVIEKEFTDVLFSLCLTILGNALRTAGEGVSKRFVADANSAFGCDVLSSLVRILGEAEVNPHDACRSARCLRVLFRACDDACVADKPKQVVAAALRVGRRSHAELADASQAALMALDSPERA